MVILITGKPGAGKTHYAQTLKRELEADGIPVHWIDGDIWRALKTNQDFSDAGRVQNLMSAAKVAAIHEAQSELVILSFVSPKKEWRDAMRKFWKQSRVVYIPGGSLWSGSSYEVPYEEEIKVRWW